VLKRRPTSGLGIGIQKLAALMALLCEYVNYMANERKRYEDDAYLYNEL
jgi:hypothetical protein